MLSSGNCSGLGGLRAVNLAFVIVIVGVKPVWLHFAASVEIVPLRLTRLPAAGDVVLTPAPKDTSARLSV
jgi:hypothetical protein